MDKKKEVTRREFLKDAALAGAGAAVFGGLAPARVLGANDRIRVGVLGSGHRARYVMGLFQKVPTVDIVAICDVYAGARAKAMEMAGASAQAYTNYHEVLDRKDIDAVLIGSPDHWHKQMLIDSVNAGKDAYCEKPIMHSIEEGMEMVRAVDATQRVVQTGTQQRSWAHWKLGKEIVDSGRLGKVTMVHTYWYQKYGPKAKLESVEPADLDWKAFLGDAPDQPFDLEKFHWWRWYWDFGGGILTDLMTHWIDVIQWYMNQPAPKTATTVGGLYTMDWQCPDTVTSAYEYPGDFMVTFTGSINSSVDDGGIMFCGSDATLKIDRSHLAVYPEGVSAVPGTLQPEPELYMRSEHDGTLDNVTNFVDCMHTRKSPNANIHVGFEAARTFVDWQRRFEERHEGCLGRHERQGSLMKTKYLSRPSAKVLMGLVLALVLVNLPLRSEEPTPSRAIYNTFTDEEEMALGRRAADETDKELPILQAPLLTAYVNHLGQKIAQNSRRPQIQYTFKIVNTDTVNAFSLPGGYIYVHRGLLDFVTNESELAGVLAHEVGHVVAYHSMNDVARRALVDQGIDQLKKAGVLNDQQVADTLQRYGGPILLFADRKFSRDEESEADMLGMYNAIRAKYDPEGLISALARLARFTGNPTLVEALLMNHPLPGERVKALRAELLVNPAPKGLEKDSLAFQAAKLQLKTLPPPPPQKKPQPPPPQQPQQ